ncbi:uncharacterized protein [Musca autumnalis]|uniref:uncharacterized protein n=1 Tax=Musca autumnalis TaxID=221902 RepID=UPI003CF23AD9
MEFCKDNKAINTLALKENLLESREFFAPQIYPMFKVHVKKILPPMQTIFYPNHVKNMHGYPMRLGINKESSRAYVMSEVNNRYILSGHVGRFFRVFSEMHNATIELPHYNLTSETTHFVLEDLVNNGTYDLSMELTFNMYVNDMIYSDIYDYMDWCIMVPMEKPVPSYLFYIKIFDRLLISIIFGSAFILALFVTLTYWLQGYTVYWQDVLFNIYIFNGILGLPFKMETKFTGVRSFLYLLTCIAGLIINSTYVTYLQTFKARPPTEKPITTLDDIRASKLKLAVYSEEFQILRSNNVTGAYEDIVYVITSYRDYYKLRDSYDSRYAYPVPSAQWSQYEQQQKFFSKPKFRLTDICFVKMIGIMIPMQPNSPFEEDINYLIGVVNQAGLIKYWKGIEFLEALQRKRLSLIDVSTVNTNNN